MRAGTRTQGLPLIEVVRFEEWWVCIVLDPHETLLLGWRLVRSLVIEQCFSAMMCVGVWA